MVPDRIGWYRHAKSGTHHGETLGLGGHKVAMEVGSDATPEDLMKLLGEGVSLDVRGTAARHPNATPEVLMKAVGDESAAVRWEAAKHPNATPEVLMKALGDKEDRSWDIREAAARHPNATAEVLMEALGDGESRVRMAAACHPNATPEILIEALGDVNHHVREAALSHPNANARIGAEWVINALKSGFDSETIRRLRVCDGQFKLSDLVRLVITDGRVDLDDLDLFQKALEESKFAQYAPLFRRMIGLEKMRRKDGV